MTTSLEIRPMERVFSRFADWFDTPEWLDRLDRQGFVNPIRIEEERTDDKLVIKAEMPGIDPDKDVDIEIVDGVLRVRAERREEHRDEKNGTVTSEFRYGTFTRTVAVPRGTTAENVTASYQDGILQITVPVTKPTEPTPVKVAVTRGS